jgi:hypothetical protein
MVVHHFFSLSKLIDIRPTLIEDVSDGTGTTYQAEIRHIDARYVASEGAPSICNNRINVPINTALMR